jgi:hypothetical protein
MHTVIRKLVVFMVLRCDKEHFYVCRKITKRELALLGQLPIATITPTSERYVTVVSSVVDDNPL